jgi:hypothetical protein
LGHKGLEGSEKKLYCRVVLQCAKACRVGVIPIVKMWKNILCHGEALQGVCNRIRQRGNAKVFDCSGNICGDQRRGACNDLETVRDKGRVLVQFCVKIGVVPFTLTRNVRDWLETL